MATRTQNTVVHSLRDSTIPLRRKVSNQHAKKFRQVLRAKYSSTQSYLTINNSAQNLANSSDSIRNICLFSITRQHVHRKGIREGKRRTRVLALSEDQSFEEIKPTSFIQNTFGGVLPRGDALDNSILRLWLPALFNFLLFPLVGAVDIFWVGRMGVAASLAAQGASDRIFSSTFWVITFLPSLVAPLVAKAAATGNTQEVQRQVGQAIFLSVIIGTFGMLLLTQLPQQALAVVGVLPGTEVFNHARPYIIIRSLSFIPAIISTVAFAAFRGTMDTMTPLKVTLCCQVLNVLLDPVLIFGLGPWAALGAAGAAMATAGAELVTFGVYMWLLLKRRMVRWRYMWQPPSWLSLRPLLVGGLAVQLRAVSLNVALICAMRSTLQMDTNGIHAAAHTLTINLWQLGGIVLLSLGSIASIIITQTVNKKASEGGGLIAAKSAADRILVWGLLMGVVLGILQVGALPLLRVFSPVEAVQEAAKVPSLIAAGTQVLNGVVFVGEGIMQGHEDFGRLALLMVLASIGLLTCLKLWGSTLVGVWSSFAVFGVIRLAGSLYHHLVTGPLSPSRIEASLALKDT